MRVPVATIMVPNTVSWDRDMDHVIEVMKRRGPPTVRVVPSKRKGVQWEALEGSHRVRAAALLGIPVILKPVRLGDKVAGGTLWVREYLEQDTRRHPTAEEILKVLRCKVGRWYRPQITVIITKERP